jgi:hypothetical protein
MRTFACAAGNGISDPSNPRVFFNVAKDGKSMGEIEFEVNNNNNAQIHIFF